MPARDTTPFGAPCWIDLMTSDVARGRDFYCALFGWTADEPNEEFGGYFNFRKDGVLVAGGMANPQQADLPDTWSVYLASPDATKATETAVANGGQVIVPPERIGDLGTMAVLTDPSGAGVGVWQPGEHKGFGVVAEDGAPCWFDLQAHEYAKSLDFYRAVFGVRTESVADTPEFRYTALTVDGDQVAGVMDAKLAGGEGCSRWSIFFGVPDTDAALRRIVELGGAVVDEAEDTPYGRLASATDPTGALFRLVAANEAMPAK